MTDKYSTVFLDLDNTIFDFSLTEKKAVSKTLFENGLPSDGETASLYSKINQFYWEKYERNEIEKTEIFVNRFKTLFEKIGVEADAQKVSEDYFNNLSKGHDLIDGALDILEYLKGKGYFLCATTNGVSKTQFRRIKEADIGKYFDIICVSEDIGFQKPDKNYFETVITRCHEKDKEKILIIGDSMSSDVLGGINAGIDVCWFNPKMAKPKYKTKYEIKKLSEIKNII